MCISDTDKDQAPSNGMMSESCRSDRHITEEGDLNACENDTLKTGMAYLTASIVIAAASAIYGLFSHGVQSYYMTYAFMVPLLGGAMPHLMAALRNRAMNAGAGAKDVQLAVIATLTTGCLLKGALDIYGTTNRLLVGYPVLAAAIAVAILIKKVRHKSADCGEKI